MEKSTEKNNFEVSICKVGDVQATEIKIIDIIKNLPRGSKVHILPSGKMTILVG